MHAHQRIHQAHPELLDSLDPRELYEAFTQNGVGYFCGVPDSVLASFGFCLEDYAKTSHDIAANEGSAIALAAGYHLATAKLPLVYMQNSGIGNALNPLVSLADPTVFAVPMILLIGWRGQPGRKDEPQHAKQGAITADLLKLLGITTTVLAPGAKAAAGQVKTAVETAWATSRPVAILVEAGTLGPAAGRAKPGAGPQLHHALSRYDALKLITESLDPTDVVVATTGKTSRELYELREAAGHSHSHDLLVVGSMGHASSLAYGIARQKPGRRVVVLDGDGAALMHMGSLAIHGSKGLKNFYHIIINNGAHESVGGQPTAGFDIDLPAIAKGSGYTYAYSADQPDSVAAALGAIKRQDGPTLLEVKVGGRARSNLGRPATRPADNKTAFMTFLDES